jgi:hypothetical protein
MKGYEQALLFPTKLPSVSELQQRKLAIVPKEPGVYASSRFQLPCLLNNFTTKMGLHCSISA